MRNFEVRLGLSQLVVLVGVLSGTMVCVFYLGFFSGRRAGFESAMDSTASNFVKLPITIDNEPIDDGSSAVEVYAKLGTHGRPSRFGETLDETLPDLDSIKSTDVAPIAEVARDDSKSAKPQSKASKEAAKSETKAVNEIIARSEADADILTVGEVLEDAASARASLRSDKPIGADKATLGSLVKKPESETAKTVESIKPAEELELAAKESLEAKIKPKLLAEESPIKTAKSSAAQSQRPSVNEPRVTTSMPKGWFAQVGNPEKYEDAQRLANKLKEGGFPVIIENARVRGEAYYRILVGPEENRQRAERLLSQLRREPGLPGDPILRMVK